jgi:hypothetical protein
MRKADFCAVHSAITGGFDECEKRFEVGVERQSIEFILLIEKRPFSKDRFRVLRQTTYHDGIHCYLGKESSIYYSRPTQANTTTPMVSLI